MTTTATDAPPSPEAQALFDELRRKGVQFSMQGADQVKADGPRAVLTDPVQAQLRQHKPDLIRILGGGGQPVEQLSDEQALQKLLAGEYQNKGVYKADMSGFNDPNLQRLLVRFAQAADVDPAAVNQETTSSVAQFGDSEIIGAKGIPQWLKVFQQKAATSSKWDTNEQAWSRLMGAFYYAYFMNNYYAPKGVPMPANVEFFLLHLGKSNPMGPKWAPKPRPGYVGNGQATFSLVGGGGANYCAAASMKALVNGLKMYGYQMKPEGWCREQGIAVKQTMAARKPGDQNRPQPGDILSIRGHGTPKSGHVCTVVWSLTDGDASGTMWYVSGNAGFASVSCDFVKVCDVNPHSTKPPPGHIALINRVITSALQPDKLAPLSPDQLRGKKITKVDPNAPPPNDAKPVEGGPPAPPPPPPTPMEQVVAAGSYPSVGKSYSGEPLQIRVDGGKTQTAPPGFGQPPPPGGPPAQVPGGIGSQTDLPPATVPPGDEEHPREPPLILKSLNTFGPPPATVSDPNDIKGVVTHIGARLREGLKDVLGHTDYNVMPNGADEQWAKLVAEMFTPFPYTMPSFYHGRGWFKHLKATGEYPLVAQCQQSVCIAAAARGYTGPGLDCSINARDSLKRTAGLWKPGSLNASGWSQEEWDRFKPGSFVLWGVMQRDPLLNSGHLAILLRKHPTKRLFQLWDTGGNGRATGKLTKVWTDQAGSFEEWWTSTIRASCIGPFQGIAYPKYGSIRTDLRPRGLCRLVIRQRGGNQVVYRSSWTGMNERRLPVTHLMRSIRALPGAAQLEARWCVNHLQVKKSGEPKPPSGSNICLDIFNDQQGGVLYSYVKNKKTAAFSRKGIPKADWTGEPMLNGAPEV